MKMHGAQRNKTHQLYGKYNKVGLNCIVGVFFLRLAHIGEVYEFSLLAITLYCDVKWIFAITWGYTVHGTGYMHTPIIQLYQMSTKNTKQTIEKYHKHVMSMQKTR